MKFNLKLESTTLNNIDIESRIIRGIYNRFYKLVISKISKNVSVRLFYRLVLLKVYIINITLKTLGILSLV